MYGVLSLYQQLRRQYYYHLVRREVLIGLNLVDQIEQSDICRGQRSNGRKSEYLRLGRHEQIKQEYHQGFLIPQHGVCEVQ